MARGNKEYRCLKRIVEYVFPNVVTPNAENADLSLLHSSVFGFAQEDWQKLCGILASAEPNPCLSEFPDFRSGNSVIEHFEITATVENRKGSEFKRKREPFLESMLEDVVAVEDPQPISRVFTYPKRRHDLLLESLKRNLEKHVEALYSYADGCAIETTVFVIEHQEYGLSMIEDIYREVGEGRVFGDMRNQQKYNNYRMSRDKNALTCLKKHANTIDFVIFCGVEHIEFIKLNEIPNMMKLMPWSFMVAAGLTVERHALLPVARVCAPEEGWDDCE